MSLLDRCKYPGIKFKLIYGGRKNKDSRNGKEVFKIRKTFGLILIMAFILVCFGLAGCSGNKKETATPAQDTEKGAGQKKAESSADLFAKGQKLEGMSYDYLLTSGNLKMSGRVFIMQNKLRSEVKQNGVEVINIMDGKTFYSYYPAQNTAMKFSSGNSEEVETPLDYIKNMNTASIRELGTEVCNGVTCRVISITTPQTKVESKMWVHGQYGIPVRVESSDGSGNKTVIDYTNIKVGKQPSELFTLPQDVKVTDMSNLPKMPGN